VRRLFFVSLSYAVTVARKMSFKLEEEELELEAGGFVLDMVTVARKGLGYECMMLAISARHG